MHFKASQASSMYTRKRIMVGTWLREISSCSYLTVLSGFAWVLQNKIYQSFFSPLYLQTSTKVGFQIPVQRHLEVLSWMERHLTYLSKKSKNKLRDHTTYRTGEITREAKARLHDPLSWIPLTSGASSPSQPLLFFDITFCIFIEILVGIGIHGDQFVQ